MSRAGAAAALLSAALFGPRGAAAGAPVPSVAPSVAPSAAPSVSPSSGPSAAPTATPSSGPTVAPSPLPTIAPYTPATPSRAPQDPTSPPSASPSARPSAAPTAAPSAAPSGAPSAQPTAAPRDPTAPPTAGPSKAPLPPGAPTQSPVLPPTAGPSPSPSAAPSLGPSARPSVSPSSAPTKAPLPPGSPTESPVPVPTAPPSGAPSLGPSEGPSAAPSSAPSAPPVAPPTDSPSLSPSASPSKSPLPGGSPTQNPVPPPTAAPSAAPSTAPSDSPSSGPSAPPSAGPSKPPLPPGSPTQSPVLPPTLSPSGSPSVAPSQNPSVRPTSGPSAAPLPAPTTAPSTGPSTAPSAPPVLPPTRSPSAAPTAGPSKSPLPPGVPTQSPVPPPTRGPSQAPSLGPTQGPSRGPSATPSQSPLGPSAPPTASPSKAPLPPGVPTESPVLPPTRNPSGSPSASPSRSPTVSPSAGPSLPPSASPTSPPMRPTPSPSLGPSAAPAKQPSLSPSLPPSQSPVQGPTASPSAAPVPRPSPAPSRSPTLPPIPPGTPTRSPVPPPTAGPSPAPSARPSQSPSRTPSQTPTAAQPPSGSPLPPPTASPSQSPTVSRGQVPAKPFIGAQLLLNCLVGQIVDGAEVARIGTTDAGDAGCSEPCCASLPSGAVTGSLVCVVELCDTGKTCASSIPQQITTLQNGQDLKNGAAKCLSVGTGQVVQITYRDESPKIRAEFAVVPADTAVGECADPANYDVCSIAGQACVDKTAIGVQNDWQCECIPPQKLRSGQPATAAASNCVLDECGSVCPTCAGTAGGSNRCEDAPPAGHQNCRDFDPSPTSLGDWYCLCDKYNGASVPGTPSVASPAVCSDNECNRGSNSQTCLDAGQQCRDPNTAVSASGDWICDCQFPSTGSAVAKVATCVLDECALHWQECADAGQTCKDPDTSPNKTSDWQCHCPPPATGTGTRLAAYCTFNGECADSANEKVCTGARQSCEDVTPSLTNQDWTCKCVAPATGPSATAKATACLLDECTATCPSCAKTPTGNLCSDVGQECVDSDTSPSKIGDWECKCKPPQVGPSSVGRTATCTLNECVEKYTVCEAAGQTCKDYTDSPAKTNDWECQCPVGQSGIAVAGPAKCTLDECIANGGVCARQGQTCTDTDTSPTALGTWECRCYGSTGTQERGPATCAGSGECADPANANVCSQAGQACYDPDTLIANNWGCECAPPQTGNFHVQAPTTCELDECNIVCSHCANKGDIHGHVCHVAHQKCVDPDKNPGVQNDWKCQCATSNGEKQGAPAVCEKDDCDQRNQQTCGTMAECVDPNKAEDSRGDWKCICTTYTVPGTSNTKRVVGESQGSTPQCRLDECAGPPLLECMNAGQECIDPDLRPESQDDWQCRCKPPNNGTRTAAPAICSYAGDCQANFATCLGADPPQNCLDPTPSSINNDWQCTCILPFTGAPGHQAPAACHLDECVQLCDTCAVTSHTTGRLGSNRCSDAGQVCHDKNPDPKGRNDWQCECVAPATGTPAQNALATCVIDECAAAPCSKTTVPGPQNCTDKNTDPSSPNDWECDCIPPYRGHSQVRPAPCVLDPTPAPDTPAPDTPAPPPPSEAPSRGPSVTTVLPTPAPSAAPSASPISAAAPSVSPTGPSVSPTAPPSLPPIPPGTPTKSPVQPTAAPAPPPGGNGTNATNATVNATPSAAPSGGPTSAPYTPGSPSASPQAPSASPAVPAQPSAPPSVSPTNGPYTNGTPSRAPAAAPSASPGSPNVPNGTNGTNGTSGPNATQSPAPPGGANGTNTSAPAAAAPPPTAAPYTPGSPSTAPAVPPSAPPVPPPAGGGPSVSPTVSPYTPGSPSTAPVSPTAAPTFEPYTNGTPSKAPRPPLTFAPVVLGPPPTADPYTPDTPSRSPVMPPTDVPYTNGTPSRSPVGPAPPPANGSNTTTGAPGSGGTTGGGPTASPETGRGITGGSTSPPTVTGQSACFGVPESECIKMADAGCKWHSGGCAPELAAEESSDSGGSTPLLIILILLACVLIAVSIFFVRRMKRQQARHQEMLAEKEAAQRKLKEEADKLEERKKAEEERERAHMSIQDRLKAKELEAARLEGQLSDQKQQTEMAIASAAEQAADAEERFASLEAGQEAALERHLQARDEEEAQRASDMFDENEALQRQLRTNTVQARSLPGSSPLLPAAAGAAGGAASVAPDGTRFRVKLRQAGSPISPPRRRTGDLGRPSPNSSASSGDELLGAPAYGAGAASGGRRFSAPGGRGARRGPPVPPPRKPIGDHPASNMPRGRTLQTTDPLGDQLMGDKGHI
eukprot:TRINITY_DN6467_c0_g4_i2.p1 TRINITY_DN6467_c0_g4~~TRINITY_DN6467_c0_g4_i2.p1  ORF type:complete len:2325 (+),score=391.35 TRINITY_DN6467_c0_g4_i2:76-6975(+)